MIAIAPSPHRANLFAAVSRVIAASAALRKYESLNPLEDQLERAMARAFRAQRRTLMARFVIMELWFPSTTRAFALPADFAPLFDDASLSTIQAFQQPLDDVTAQALASGIRAAIVETGMSTSLSLAHPAAVDYLSTNGAERVTQINETTRRYLQTTLTQAADEGWSYDKTAKAIRDRYTDFSKVRAKNIAVFETGNAYEHGNMLVAKDLQGSGLFMEKSWLTVGDDRVRPEHRANQAQGWIDFDAQFQNGSERPPTDPRCRCTILYQRKPTGLGTAPSIEPEDAALPPDADRAFAYDADAFKAYRNRQYEEWAAGASDEEITALRQYKSARYQSVNKYLRTGKASGGQTETELSQFVKTMDKGLKRATLEEDVIVHRGIAADPFNIPTRYSDLKPGSIMTDKGYVSTTTNKTAEKFAPKRRGSYLMEIKVPKGSRGLNLDPLGDAQTRNEGEILLPRGSKLLIKSVTEERNGRTKIIAELVS